MKKIFLALSALAALTAVSCVKDELNPDALVPPAVPDPDPTLCINELDPNNKKIELYNYGSVDLAIGGYSMTKDGADMWNIPSGTTLKAGEVVVYTAKSDDPKNGPSFGMSATKGFVLELFDAKGNSIDKVDNSKGSDKFYSFPEDVEPVTTLGRKTDGGNQWVLFLPGSIGESNSKGTVLVNWGDAVPEAVVLFNELCGNKIPDGPQKYIELLNSGDADADLSDWTIRKYPGDAGKYDEVWKAPKGTKLASGKYLVLEADQTDPTKGFNAGLSAKKALKFELVDASGKVVDLFLRGEDKDPFEEPGLPENKNASFSRVPNGSGPWAYAAPTPGAANGEKTGEIEHK